MDNPAFTRKVADCPGGTELLLALGFLPDEIEGVDFWVCPQDASIPNLKLMIKEMDAVLKTIDYKPPPAAPKPAKAAAPQAPVNAAGGSNPLLANMNGREGRNFSLCVTQLLPVVIFLYVNTLLLCPAYSRLRGTSCIRQQ